MNLNKLSQMRNILLGLMLFAGLASNAQNGTIKGKVTDMDGTALAYANVVLLNTTNVTATDEFGVFEFKNLKPNIYKINITAIGYASKVKVINLKDTVNQELSFQLEEDLKTLEEVVVTAEKSENRVQDVPVAISAINAKQIKDLRVFSTNDLTGIAPNLNVTSPGDQRVFLSIRGINSTTDIDPAVATYVDGVNQFDINSIMTQLNDIERIEVLRGPQGTLYGRNAMGGVINIITKAPSNIMRGFAEASLGNFGMQRYSVGFSTPIIKNKLFVGASGIFENRNGYFTNIATGKDFDNPQSVSGNFYLKYLPGKDWKITLNAKTLANQNRGSFPYVANDSVAFAQPFRVNQNVNANDMNNISNISLTVNKYAKNYDFVSTTAFQHHKRRFDGLIDGDFGPLALYSFGAEDDKKTNFTNVISQEIRISNSQNTSSKWRWTAGTFLFYQESPTNSVFNTDKDAAAFDPLAPYAYVTRTTAYNSGYAFFGQLGYQVTKKLELSAGVRYDQENRILNISGEILKDQMPPIPALPATRKEGNFNALSPKAVAKYSFTANHQAYLSYARGFRSGGLNRFTNDPQYIAFNPEFNDNFELGVKTEWFKNRLRANFTAFYISWKDVQVNTVLPGSGFNVAVQNTGNINSKGIEVELAMIPIKGLQIEYNGGVTQAEFTTLKFPDFATQSEKDLKGNKQIMTPNYTSFFAAQYSIPFKVSKQAINFILRGEIKNIGTTYLDLQNKVKQDPYTLVNIRTGFSSKNLDMFFWVRNLSNETYLGFGYPFGNSAVMLAPPRTLGATITAKF
jgi:iron complex outermembrane receptor protein